MKGFQRGLAQLLGFGVKTKCRDPGFQEKNEWGFNVNFFLAGGLKNSERICCLESRQSYFLVFPTCFTLVVLRLLMCGSYPECGPKI